MMRPAIFGAVLGGAAWCDVANGRLRAAFPQEGRGAGTVRVLRRSPLASRDEFKAEEVSEARVEVLVPFAVLSPGGPVDVDSDAGKALMRKVRDAALGLLVCRDDGEKARRRSWHEWR